MNACLAAALALAPRELIKSLRLGVAAPKWAGLTERLVVIDDS